MMTIVTREELERRIDQEIAKRKTQTHVVMLLFAISAFAIMTGIALTMEPLTDATFLAAMGGLMAVFFHVLAVARTHHVGDDLRRRIASEILAQSMLEPQAKRKNDADRLVDDMPSDGEVVMLGDDGELRRVKR